MMNDNADAEATSQCKLKRISIFFIFSSVVLYMYFIIGMNNSLVSIMQSVNLVSSAISADDFAQRYQLQPKQFQIYKHDFPCVSNKRKLGRKAGEGFYYIKIHKTGSTTMVKIVEKIASSRAKKNSKCYCTDLKHRAAYQYLQLKNRAKNNQPRSFLFTIVREPTSRELSNYIYESVIQKKCGRELGVENFKADCCRKKFKLEGMGGFQSAFMSTDEKLPMYTFWKANDPERIQQPDLLFDRIDNLFNSYDFIGVSERLNESLVILSFLLDLSLTDIAYQSFRKNSGNYVQGGGEGRRKCYKSVSKQEGITKDIEMYLQSDEWKARTAADRLLHKSVLEAMDNTINNVIGRTKFQERLEKFEELLGLMEDCETVCAVCSEDGKLQKKKGQCLECKNRILDSWSEEMKA